MPTEELFGSYNFLLEVAGVSAGAFKNVEGLDSETEVSARSKWIKASLKRTCVIFVFLQGKKIY